MSESTILFLATCPKGHKGNQSLSAKEVDRGLTDDTLKFYCTDCHESWKPTTQEKANLRHRLMSND